MNKLLLTTIFLFCFAFASKSQNADTLKVRQVDCNFQSRFLPDSVIFTLKNDTLIINDKRWAGIALKLIAPRSYNGDTMKISVIDTAKGALLALCRLNYIIKIPNAFAKSAILDLKFRGKYYKIDKILTALNEPVSNLQLAFFPNPVKNHLHIETQQKLISIAIRNIAGVPIFSVAGDMRSIDFSILEPGIYLVSFQSENGIVTKSIVKE